VLRLTGEILEREPLYLAAAAWSIVAMVILVRATRRMKVAR
jgi:hypothetical protein